MHYWGYNTSFFGPGFGLLEFIFPILFWVLIIGLIISIFRHRHNADEEKTKEIAEAPISNLEIIKRRYAEGKINKKEFEQLKKDLS